MFMPALFFPESWDNLSRRSDMGSHKKIERKRELDRRRRRREKRAKLRAKGLLPAAAEKAPGK
jgi:hypothetical protein